MRSHAKAATAGSNLRWMGAARLVLLCAAALLLTALFAVPAQAAPKTIAEAGQGAGEVERPQGTAVHQASGDLYVADQDNNRIDKFDSEGNFLLAWGYGVADGATEALQTCGPAASPPTARCFAGPNFFSEALRARDVVVDQASGDIWVADPFSRRVLKFTSSGQLVFMVGRNVNKTKVAEGGATQEEKNFCAAAGGDTCGTGESGGGPNEFANPLSLAIEDSGPNAGRVWVGDNDRLVAIEPGGTPGPEAALPGTGNTGSLAVDSAGDFYIVRPGTIELQLASFSGLAPGDTFALGNLPASCSASETGPIAYFPVGGGTGAEEAVVRESLEEKCGDAIVFFGNGLNFVNQSVYENAGQLTCATLTGGGSCSVTTAQDGVPGTVEKRDPSGALLETLYSGAPEALTLDAAGNLYVGDRKGKYHFLVLNSAGETTSVFGAGQVKVNTTSGEETGKGPVGNGLALDEGSGTLYAANSLGNGKGAVQAFPLLEPGPLPENQHVEDLEPTTVTLAADLNPEGDETTYHFEWGTTPSYGQTTPTKTLPGSAFDSEAVQEALSGLTPDTTYHFRLVATNHCKPSEPSVECTVEGPDTTFTTRPAVAIDAQRASDITATSAVLNAELDPIGVAAQWWIEYGTSESYGSTTPEGALPATFGDVAVNTLLRDLVPGTTYHYRFAARDERDGTVYTVHGEDRVFTTQVSALGFELADDRAWEMVSPPNKFGALIVRPAEGHTQAAAEGDALAYFTINSIETAPEGNRVAASALARREAGAGWRSKDISPPHTVVTPVTSGTGDEYKLFSSNLERGMFDQRDTGPLSPAASERTPYLRQNTEPAAYTPLVTGKEGFANVPPGTEFGGGPDEGLGPVKVAGATPDLSHVVLQSEVPLAAGAGNQSLYEWEAGQLRQVSILPAGEAGATVGAQLGSGSGSARKAISDDGSRLFWSTPGSGDLTGLYVRDMAREETVRLDVVQPGSLGIGKANPVFQGANPEGTVALFTDSHQLSEDANEKGRDLYRCEVTVEGGQLGCDLTNLTTGTVGPGESAEVQGLVSGMNEDATHAYFVAKGALDSQPNGQGDGAVPGQPNLYLWQQGGGIRFIATLAEEDKTDWAAGGGVFGSLAFRLSADASPGGRYLTFMSQRSLTGYDNRDAKSGEPNQEVFRYDAVADELICASCNPSGARPVGVLLPPVEESEAKAIDLHGLWHGHALAAVLPQATKLSQEGASLYRSRAVHDNGRLFFNAVDSLVPADSNGNWDVYQYEPTGTGDCTSSSGGASISRSAGGCVSLISSGTAEEESSFLDASVGGGDVFFYTSAQLSVTDEDEEVDIYDARVNGIPATLAPSTECLGEACQPAARVPDDPTPTSASFRGQGNEQPSTRKRCAKGKRAVKRGGKSRCVSRNQKRQSDKRKASRNRGAKR